MIGYNPTINYARKMLEPTSVFTAELTAIHCAIASTKTTSNENITIISDSKSSIQAINSIYSKNPLVGAIRDDMQASNNQYLLCWVPSHVGITGNETADKLAKETTKSNAQMTNLLLRSDVKNHIKQMAKTAWKQRWTATSERNKLRRITDNLTPLPNSSFSNRRCERTLARLRLGHTRLTHGALLTGDLLHTCQDCDKEDQLSVQHILTECEMHRFARLRCFHRTTVTMKSLLVDGDTSPGGPLARFISDIGLMNSL